MLSGGTLTSIRGFGVSESSRSAQPLDGLGWQPKWGKPRKVYLLDGALEVLKKLKISRPLKTEGHVLIRDQFGKVTAKEFYEADFIFHRNMRPERKSDQVVSRRIDTWTRHSINFSK